MSIGAVMSLYSMHAQNIYDGKKRFEYRTRKPAREVEYLAIYETGDAHAVTGIAKISGVLEETPDEVWKLTKSFAGISAKYFKDSFRKKTGICILHQRGGKTGAGHHAERDRGQAGTAVVPVHI
jgi:predicted transcriptional regulator